jgi:hypothetical protein
MNRIRSISVLWLAAVGCGDAEPVDVTGSYSVSVTNGDNGCEFANWTVGATATGIPVTITQDGEEATASVEAGVGLYLGLLLGSSDFTGTVDGQDLDLTLFGTNDFDQGSCSYTVNADLDAELDGDVLTGRIRYETNTNGSPDCGEKEGCSSEQEFNGTRPPT